MTFSILVHTKMMPSPITYTIFPFVARNMGELNQVRERERRPDQLLPNWWINKKIWKCKKQVNCRRSSTHWVHTHWCSCCWCVKSKKLSRKITRRFPMKNTISARNRQKWLAVTACFFIPKQTADSPRNEPISCASPNELSIGARRHQSNEQRSKPVIHASENSSFLLFLCFCLINDKSRLFIFVIPAVVKISSEELHSEFHSRRNYPPRKHGSRESPICQTSTLFFLDNRAR